MSGERLYKAIVSDKKGEIETKNTDAYKLPQDAQQAAEKIIKDLGVSNDRMTISMKTVIRVPIKERMADASAKAEKRSTDKAKQNETGKGSQKRDHGIEV